MLALEFIKMPGENGHCMFISSRSGLAKTGLLMRLITLQLHGLLLLFSGAWLAAASGGSLPLTTVIWWGDRNSRTQAASDLTNAVNIAAGANHTLALKPDGTVIGWGDQFTGEAEALAGVTDAKAVSVGYQHALLLRSNGTVIAWGDGVSGENVVPPGLSNIIAVAAGSENSLLVKSDGTVVAWGGNFFGETTGPPGLSDGGAG